MVSVLALCSVQKPLRLSLGIIYMAYSVSPSIETHYLSSYFPSPAFQEYAIFKSLSQLFVPRILDNPEGLPWSVYVGVCGMPGIYIVLPLNQMTTLNAI